MAVTPQQAIQKLLDGNKRFVNGEMTQRNVINRRKELVAGQHPFATIICCSDSRAPAEYVFDTDMGEIFVIRTAGGTLGTFEFGSIEYAVSHLHTPLVVVLGHTLCGACTAACDTHHAHEGHTSLTELIGDISPIAKQCKYNINDTIVELARSNVQRIMQKEEIKPYLGDDKCIVVPMLYNLETGVVDQL